MKLKLVFVVVLVLLTMGVVARDTKISKITNDVIVVTPGKKQLHTLGWPNDIINSVALKTSKGIVLVDTQNSPANAILIKDAVTNSFNDTVFAYIINTHGHSCHSGGNCIFEQDNIVAHTNSAGEIKDYDDLFLGQTVEFLRKKIYHKTNILDTITTEGVLADSINEAIDLYRFYESDLINNYQARYPDMTFEDRLTLNAGDKTIDLLYMGKGHGDADIVVYFKEDKVLCTGNLFHLGAYKEESMPSFYINRPNEINHWISTLNTVLEENPDIKHVISTHGTKSFNRENIEFIRDYCMAVEKEVKNAKANNLAVESLNDLDVFKDVFNKYRNIVSKNAGVQRMHEKNIQIIWKHIK